MSTKLQIQTRLESISNRNSVPKQTGLLQRKCACGGTPGIDGECAECRSKRLSLQRSATNQSSTSAVPPIVHDVLRSPGQPLDAGTRAFMEPRFGHDFSNVRVHTDARAAESAKAVNALAYTVGKDVVFEAGQYAPGTGEGKRLLAHELTHVAQQQHPHMQKAQHINSAENVYEQEAEQVAHTISADIHTTLAPKAAFASAPSNTLFPYRSRTAFNFGRFDTDTLKEEVFTDPKTQPWIQTITVTFDGKKLDENGVLIPTGKLEATYASNIATMIPITMDVTGGATNIGFTDRGNFTVTRIEGIGYNDLPLPESEGEGPRKKYAKSLTASMSYAIFFHRGQAIHIGSLNLGSHACVHGGNDASAWTMMQQLNYHSVVGRTKVNVSYDSSALKDLCCARMDFLGITRKGTAPNPCRSEDPTTCTP